MKKRNAQQLIEFLFIAPFIIIIFGILTEFAYALNVNLALYHGLRTVTSTIYSKIKPGLTAEEIRTLVENQLTINLRANNVPTNTDNEIQVQYATVGENATFVASYTYISAIRLPKVYFHILPEEFHFTAVAVVPAAFLRPNNYDSSINSTTLDAIWTGNASLGSLDAFDDTKKGVMKETLNSADDRTKKMVFLVPVDVIYNPFNSDSNTYYIVDWNGYAHGNGSYNYVADLDSGLLYNCSVTEIVDGYEANYCAQTGGTVQNEINGRTTVYAFEWDDYGMTYGTSDEKDCKVGNRCYRWLVDASDNVYAGPVSDPQADGALKRALSMYHTTSNQGNYDGIDVKSYNSAASGGNIYQVQYKSGEEYIFIKGSGSTIQTYFGGKKNREKKKRKYINIFISIFYNISCILRVCRRRHNSFCTKSKISKRD